MALRRRAVDDALVSWDGRRVLVTGHTGFKGSWLSLWLRELGADVVGVADGVPTTPSLYASAGVADLVHDVRADVTDQTAVRQAVVAAEPDVVFHLAAQSLVRRSYTDPVGTWRTNVDGTVAVLEAVRAAPSVRAVVVVTSDKCYRQPGPGRPYLEDDALGGDDPYSSSKAAAELATASWRRSFLDDGPPVATARAGNVLGGGDWAPDRLVPDTIRAASAGRPLVVRNPSYTRPWQDVLDCLHGYLLLAEALLAGEDVAEAWNFGPDPEAVQPVRAVVDGLARRWPGGFAHTTTPASGPHEASALLLDSSKARARLGWAPRRSLEDTLDHLVEWYVTEQRGDDVAALCLRHLRTFGPPATVARA